MGLGGKSRLWGLGLSGRFWSIVGAAGQNRQFCIQIWDLVEKWVQGGWWNGGMGKVAGSVDGSGGAILLGGGCSAGNNSIIFPRCNSCVFGLSDGR